ncbi:hypothetical protein [Pontibacter harenae]|uniref:hypothetical protein n=1 Tax=Pontibacter harenae TaxID=2894083 RepID=UPI001E329557|nr:hypothetical protein [Pontibacter harenae]MCC9167676.1 hypothetical protein [Pontibacter harenae]
MQSNSNLKEIYKTGAGAIYQCDRQNRFLLEFAGSLTVLKVDAFIRLKQIIEKIDLVEMANSTDRSSDVEIIYPVGCDCIYVLTLPEVLSLSELLSGAMAMLTLNSMLHECLTPTVA